MVCALRALLCLPVCVCVYLICLISVGRSVCLYSLHFAGSRLPPPGSVLACPVQSCPVQSTWQSSAHPVVSSLLVWSFSFPNHLTSPPSPSFTLPSKQGLEGVCSTAQHRTQSILQARHLLTEFSHCVHLPSSHQFGGQPLSRVHTGPRGKLLAAAAVRVPSNLSLPAESTAIQALHRVSPGSPPQRVLQRRTARLSGFRSTSAGPDCTTELVTVFLALQLTSCSWISHPGRTFSRRRPATYPLSTPFTASSPNHGSAPPSSVKC